MTYVNPIARHLLTRIRAKIRVPRHNRQSLRLATEEIHDLILWTHFLTAAHKGISLNRITIRLPSRLTISDACPYGVGRYSLRGPGWRFAIPRSSPLYGDSRFNNLWEFLGMVVGIWLEIMAADEGSSECILALGDNTSAIGWLFRSGRVDRNSLSFTAVQKVARHLAMLVLNSDHCLASQHLKGEKNIVADLLSYTGSSRGHDHPLAADEPSDEVLTHRFHIFLPSQILRSFEISALPCEVLSWVTQILQTAESSLTQDKKTPTKSTTKSGDDGNHSAPKERSHQ